MTSPVIITVWVQHSEGWRPAECHSAAEVLEAIRQAYGSEYRITRSLDQIFLRHLDDFVSEATYGVSE